MKIVVDANIIVSAILGRRSRFSALLERGVVLMAAEAQAIESARVLARLTGMSVVDAAVEVEAALAEFVVLVDAEIGGAEAAARARLEPRGQSDWPVLATAMTFDADIWSNDRDFFGVGLPVWSMRNIKHAYAQGVSNG